MSKSKNIVATIVESFDGSAFVRSMVKGRRVVLRPSRNGDTYLDAESAKRAWRKFANANRIKEYSYRMVTA